MSRNTQHMKAEAVLYDDPVHGPSLAITYHVRWRDIELRAGFIEHVTEFVTKDLVRRALAWKNSRRSTGQARSDDV